VIEKGHGFREDRTGGGGTGWHGVLASVSEPRNTEGHDREAVVGEGIYVSMEAVRQT
jgi:hypothetical protein